MGYFSIIEVPFENSEEVDRVSAEENPYNESGLEGLGDKRKYWPIGATIRVSFMGGISKHHKLVEQYANEWCRYANISFIFGNHPKSEIRISFRPDGSRSCVGIDALRFRQNQSTMNLDPQMLNGQRAAHTILHEFGHALGLLHEHQSPTSPIQWNKDAVLQDCKNMKWSYETTMNNILRACKPGGHTQFTEFDPDSIMIYRIPKSWTKNNFRTKENKKLSKMDKHFIQMIYPS